MLEMTNEQAKALGNELVKLFNLKPIKTERKDAEVRYQIDYGDKTAEGVARCAARVLQQAGYVVSRDDVFAEEETRI